ncbi:MAE_28990/MAE_18760 family HEPN-like nuclease [Streptomyces sp. IBSNAI001]|uniref:MAE_28990/MAE_18760 family HEPN-like nuclease n=1 Tax=Streptomyces sp. IBSNAI001 TaxID=3457499 RepID=UPI003FD29FF1
MNISDLRLELENDLSWRLGELRHLRNRLLAGAPMREWEAKSMRAILVMQYAHLEGFTRNALSLYVDLINHLSLRAHEVHPQLLASALAAEFKELAAASAGQASENEGKLTRRAKSHVTFLGRLRELSDDPLQIAAELAVSTEMNLGNDVLRRNLFMLGIPEDKVHRSQYVAIEFVKTTRNDIAHGSRKEVIPPSLFEAHWKKCEQFMNDLARIITTAASEEWFRTAPAVGKPGGQGA